MAQTYNYIRDPAAIYAESFRLIGEATDLSALPEALHAAAIRIVHACGRPEVVSAIAGTPDIADAVSTALSRGCTVLTDAEMVSHGIIRTRLPDGVDVLCTLKSAGVPGAAKRMGTTRSAAAVELWKPWIEGAVVVIGNAPTALFHLLERLHEGWPKPAAIIGMPVGFVGAAESKQALAEAGLEIPYLTVHGREGGSAMAAAAFNALAGGNEA